MSYTFVKIATFYPFYLYNYYAQNQGITKASYSEQLTHMMADAFGWADFFAKNLRKLGVDAYEIVANAGPLQKAWANEHGLKAKGKSLLVEQLKVLQPDVVFWDSLIHNGKLINHIKEHVKSIRQTIGYCGAPYSQEHMEQFKVFDYMLTCAPGFVSDMKKHGIRSYLLNHAFEDSLLAEIKDNNTFPVTDVLFVGSLTSGSGSHNLRKKVIEELLAEDFDVQVHSQLPEEKLFSLCAKQGAYLFANTLKKFGLGKLSSQLPGIRKAAQWRECPNKSNYSKMLKQRILPPLFGLKMFKALSRAKIGFNIHIDDAGSDAGNMRLFEATGVGTCLVTDWKENLKDLFEPEKEVVIYRSTEECIEKIEWLLKNPIERENIAKAGQNRTLRDHTYERRAAELDEIVRKMMP